MKSRGPSGIADVSNPSTDCRDRKGETLRVAGVDMFLGSNRKDRSG